MKTLGIISEFNPFHNGHKYLLDKAKKDLNTDVNISIMSGDFVQRGEASIMDKFTRAQTAIDAGFDLVVEIPSFVSLQAAEFFAFKSVSILDKMNVDYLVFGIENIDSINFINQSRIIIENQNEIDNKIKKLLKDGLSYPKAYNISLLDFVDNDFISSNNVLALEYIRAIKKLNSKIEPYPIKRIKSLNKDQFINDENFASSTAIRNNLFSDINKLMPSFSYENLMEFQKKFNSINENDLYAYFRYKILIEKAPMTKILGYEVGIDNFLARLAEANISYDSFLNQATSQRYTRSRIKRLVLNYLLNNTTELNGIDISFIKVLAYRQRAIDLFKDFSNKLDIIISKKNISKLNGENLLIYNKIVEASNLYSLCINRDFNIDFTHNNRPIGW